MENLSHLDPKLPDLFASIMKDKTKAKNITFLKPNDSCIIFNNEVGLHGHIGLNGGRGLNAIHRKITTKFITAHSHSAMRIDGLTTVGTSSNLDRNYTSGLSTWSHTHCILSPNGKIQLIYQHPNDGKFRAGKNKNKSIKLIDINETDFINHTRLPDDDERNKEYKVTDPDGNVYYINGRYELQNVTDLSDWKSRMVMASKHKGWKVEVNEFKTE